MQPAPEIDLSVLDSLLRTPPLDPDATDTTTRLMVAAASAFAERGFHATTTRDIAQRAGLSPAGVYVHFSSKEDLLFAVSRHGHAAARDMLRRAATSALTPTAALRAIIGGFSRWHAEHYDIGRIVQHEFRHLSPAHRDEVIGLRKEIDRVVRDVLEQGVLSGEFEIDDVPVTALALLSMAVDVSRWYAPDIRRTPHQIGRDYADLAERLVTRAR